MLQAWLEASTKGSVLILTSTEAELFAREYLHVGHSAAGVIGGVAGGAAQSYLTMGAFNNSIGSENHLLMAAIGITTSMKTAEITRAKTAAQGLEVPTTMQLFLRQWKTKGIRGVNRGVNAVALRQITGWASRFGISRYAEGQIRSLSGKGIGERLSVGEKLSASLVGGALSCWNQPFEVSINPPTKLTHLHDSFHWRKE